MASDSLGALAAAFDVYAAALTDDQFNELVARTRTPKQPSDTDSHGGVARGREAFKNGSRLASIAVENEPATNHIINT